MYACFCCIHYMRVCWLYCIHSVLWYLYRFLFKWSEIRNIRIAYIFWYIICALTRLPSFLFCLFVRNLFLDGCDELKHWFNLPLFPLFSFQYPDSVFLCPTTPFMHWLYSCCSPVGAWWKWNEILPLHVTLVIIFWPIFAMLQQKSDLHYPAGTGIIYYLICLVVRETLHIIQCIFSWYVFSKKWFWTPLG